MVVEFKISLYGFHCVYVSLVEFMLVLVCVMTKRVHYVSKLSWTNLYELKITHMNWVIGLNKMNPCDLMLCDGCNVIYSLFYVVVISIACIARILVVCLLLTCLNQLISIYYDLFEFTSSSKLNWIDLNQTRMN